MLEISSLSPEVVPHDFEILYYFAGVWLFFGIAEPFKVHLTTLIEFSEFYINS